MAKAQMRKELDFETANEAGMLAKICENCGNAGTNIDAISGWVQENKAHFRLCTSDDAKAAEALKAMGLEVSEKEVVTLDVEDSPGKMAEVTKKIADAGVDLRYIYGSAGTPGQPAFVVLNSNNNAKVLELFS